MRIISLCAVLVVSGCYVDEVFPKAKVINKQPVSDAGLCTILSFQNQLTLFKVNWVWDAPKHKKVGGAKVDSYQGKVVVFNGSNHETLNTVDVNSGAMAFGETDTVDVPYGVETMDGVEYPFFSANVTFKAEAGDPYTYQNNYLSQNGDGICGFVYFYKLVDDAPWGGRVASSGSTQGSSGSTTEGASGDLTVSIRTEVSKFNVSQMSKTVPTGKILVQISDFIHFEADRVIEEVRGSVKAKLAGGVATVSESSARVMIQDVARERLKEAAKPYFDGLETGALIEALVQQI